MAVLQLPEYIYSGMDSISRIFDSECKKMLVISSVDAERSTNILSAFFQKAQKHSVKADFLTEDNPSELFSLIQEKLVDETPELIVAVGDGKIIDCAMAVSSMSGIPYCAVPQVAPSALWESDSVEAFMTRKIPSVCVLDPDIIVNSNSAKIAYEGLGMLTVCAESFLCADGRYVKSMAKTAFRQIYENLFDAFKGEISARENLLEGMYWAYISFVNSHDFSWESPCYRLCDFFKSFGIDALSLLAASCVQVVKNVYKDNESALRELACEVNASNQQELSSMYLIEKIRQIRAKMFVPSCIRNLGADEGRFLILSQELGEEDRQMLFDCYYPDRSYSKLCDNAFVGG
ncbi:MAG: iron-containing alcohol dehydrogenase [Clostridia bacterium]|nr:iron-containing alcohol dehydrogenase [Clostridia bacterium]